MFNIGAAGRRAGRVRRGPARRREVRPADGVRDERASRRSATWRSPSRSAACSSSRSCGARPCARRRSRARRRRSPAARPACSCSRPPSAPPRPPPASCSRARPPPGTTLLGRARQPDRPRGPPDPFRRDLGRPPRRLAPARHRPRGRRPAAHARRRRRPVRGAGRPAPRRGGRRRRRRRPEPGRRARERAARRSPSPRRSAGPQPPGRARRGDRIRDRRLRARAHARPRGPRPHAAPVALLVPADVIHVAGDERVAGRPRVPAVRGPGGDARRSSRPSARACSRPTLQRFSPLALASVLALAATGTIQALVEVRPPRRAHEHGVRPRGPHQGRAARDPRSGSARSTASGSCPTLRRLAAGGAAARRRGPPAAAHAARRGRAHRRRARRDRRARRATRRRRPRRRRAVPCHVSTRMGPIELQMTVDPARIGPNQMHLYLFDAKDGAPFTRHEGADGQGDAARASGIGPLALTMHRAGPGHYVADAVTLSPGGDWKLAVTDRVSDFDEYTGHREGAGAMTPPAAPRARASRSPWRSWPGCGSRACTSAASTPGCCSSRRRSCCCCRCSPAATSASARSRRCARRSARPAARALRLPRPAARLVPRGGLLVGCSLAGRAPPAV